MKSIENPLTVPPAILSLGDVTASEKLLLALYAVEPGAINFVAMRTLGVALSGLKKIKNRLVAKGYLRVTANGYEVLVPGLQPEPGGGHLVSNLSSVKKQEKVALAQDNPEGALLVQLSSAPISLPTEDFVTSEMRNGFDRMLMSDFAGAKSHYQRAKQRVQEDPGITDEGKAQAIRLIESAETRAMAYHFGGKLVEAKLMPGHKIESLAFAISKLSPEKLKAIRPRLEQATLEDVVDVLALPWC